MPNTNITTVEGAGFIPEIWLNVALGRLRNYLTLVKTIMMDTDLEGGAFQYGETLHLPKRGLLTVNDKGQNANYTVQNPTGTTVDVTLNKHKEVTFGVESRAMSVANQDQIAGYVEDAVVAIAEQIDTDLLGMWSLVPAGQVITNAGTMTEANILSARKILVDNKVPALAPKFGIIDTAQTNALLQIDRLVRYDALGVSNDISNAMVGNGVRVMPASIGRLYNFEISESQLTPVTGSPLAAHNLFYARDAFLMAMRALENPEAAGAAGVNATVITDPESGLTMRLLHSYQHLQGAHLITLDVLYGFGVQRAEHVVRIDTSP